MLHVHACSVELLLVVRFVRCALRALSRGPPPAPAPPGLSGLRSCGVIVMCLSIHIYHPYQESIV